MRGIRIELGLRIICTILLTSILASAASTKFVSTWSNPVAGSLGEAGKRVAAFVLSSDETMRQGRKKRWQRRCAGAASTALRAIPSCLVS